MEEKDYAGPPSEISPVKADDMATRSPPPSYQEVMGQFMTSVTQGQQEIPPLSYIDIMPRLVDAGNMENNIMPKFEKFSDIMLGANMWLQSNPGLEVWKCEIVERKVERGPVVQLDSTVHHESAFGTNVYVNGVRLWLTRKRNPNSPAQELALLNVPAPLKEIPVTMMGTGMMGFGMGMNMGAMPMMPVMHFGRRRGRVAMVAQGMIQTYEGLSKAVESYNEAIKTDPLDGSILNVETAWVKFGEGAASGEADPDDTSWSERSNGMGLSLRRFTKILRVFYIKGPPKKEILNMVTLLPKVLQAPEWNRSAKFETFDCVLTQAQQWLQAQSGARIINIETRDTEWVSGFGQPVTFKDDSTDEFILASKETNMARYLRIFYISAPDMPSYSSTVLTSHLFVPVRLGGNRFETMAQTMDRINAWLSAVGQPIFSVETVPFLLGGSKTVDPNRVQYKHNPRVGNYWLTAIRLYFPTPFQEPPPGPSASDKQSSACMIL